MLKACWGFLVVIEQVKDNICERVAALQQPGVTVWKDIFSPASFSIILLFENLTYPANHSLELEMCFPEQ